MSKTAFGTAPICLCGDWTLCLHDGLDRPDDGLASDDSGFILCHGDPARFSAYPWHRKKSEQRDALVTGRTRDVSAFGIDEVCSHSDDSRLRHPQKRVYAKLFTRLYADCAHFGDCGVLVT